MTNNLKSNTSFWTEISDYRIQVPYYQRDYAQGRTDGGRIDNIRKVFVEELYKAINNNGICHLGLVFGSYDENNKIFVAVDGQQRLTTVFLLHWFVAWRENKLDDYKTSLTNFSWDTRSYSSQFVELLFKIKQSNNVVEAITTNCDYFPIWENDPTVKGMLTMLKEIEEQYPQGECELCPKLFLNDCNIRYDILKLEKNSDGKTYLKMNSRGRSLTTFELFKSKFMDKYKHKPVFFRKFDNEWLNFMLQKFTTNDDRSSDPDIPFMNFINEYTYLQLRLKDGSDNLNEYKEFVDAKVKGELTDVPFISFDKYTRAFDGDCLIYFENSFDWICNNYEIIKQADEEIRFSDSRFFIDAIIKENNPNFSHRTKLFAALKYAELTNYTSVDHELYKKWTRIFRNLVANTNIESSNFGEICQAINEINNPNIYEYLSDGGLIKSFLREQVQEETAKAKQILNGKPRSDGNTWEEVIIEAESYAFFKGAIRFLFTDGEGNNINWCDFDTKWSNAKEYFDEKGVRDGKEKYKSNALLMKLLLANDAWENILWYFEFSNNAARWRQILLIEDRKKVKDIARRKKAVDIILSTNITKEITAKYVDETKNVFIKNIIDDGLMNYVCNNMSGAWLRSTYHGYQAIWVSGYPASQVVLNPILSKLQFEGKISYRNTEGRDSSIPNCRYYKCINKNVDFKYNFNDKYYYFNWWGNPNQTELDVYLTEEKWADYKKRLNPTNDKNTDEDTRYCFRVTEEMKSDTKKFTDALDSLINKANNDSKTIE